MRQQVEGQKSSVALSVLVAALGYFVDIYDLILFSIVRLASLADLGIPKEQALGPGTLLINMQMTGMLLGGVLWGVLGDKRGRISVLYGSILMYSLANLANAFVQDVNQYAILRFIAGVGLAGELGAGITLVSEIMDKEKRGWGTTIVASVGICGAIAAGIIAQYFDWRTAYIIGGVMGLALLALRIGVTESGMFKSLDKSDVARGNFFDLLRGANLKTYLACILIGVPMWFVVGILVTFSPELGTALGMNPTPNPAQAVMFCYAGLALGDLLSGFLSQVLKSRKKVVALFILATAALIAVYANARDVSVPTFNFLCLVLGIAAGYWAVFVTIAAEQFGTNIRATAATTVPNFVRGALVPMTLAFSALKPSIGVLNGALVIGYFTIALALLSLLMMKETFGKDLDYVES
jgi:MFS transporter, putative metabolite:H+ symporter